MAQIFSTQIITEAGLSLAAQATSTHPISFVGALSSATIPADPREISQYTGREGQIDASSATDNVARIVVAFLNALDDNPQPMKAIALTGKLSNEPDSAAVIVAYAYDSASAIVLPRSSAPDQVMRFGFNLTFNAGSTVAVFQTGDATIEDLFNLVSCHKAGQPTVGADQTIYGEKTFKDTIMAGQIQSDGADSGYHLLVTGGKNNPKGVKIGWDSTDNTDQVYIGGMGGGWVFNDTLLRADGNGVIGNTSYPISRIVATTIEPTYIGTTSHKVTTIYAQSIGTNSYRVGDIFANRFFGGTFSGSLVDGTTPQPTYDSTAASPVKIPVGGIALVFVYYDWSYNLHCGETFQCGVVGGHYTTIREAAYIDDSPAPHWEPGEVVETDNGDSTYYTWKLLSCLDSASGLGTNSYGLAFVMRIE